jgi:hypothetical protein
MSGSFRYSVAVPAHGSHDLNVAVPPPTLNRRRSSTAAKGSSDSSAADIAVVDQHQQQQQQQQVVPTVAARTVTTVALRGMDPALKACFPVVYSPAGEDILTSGGSGEHTSVRTVELHYTYTNVS